MLGKGWGETPVFFGSNSGAPRSCVSHGARVGVRKFHLEHLNEGEGADATFAARIGAGQQKQRGNMESGIVRSPRGPSHRNGGEARSDTHTKGGLGLPWIFPSSLKEKQKLY